MLISTTAEEAKRAETIHDIDGQPYIGREYIGAAPKPGTDAYGKDAAGDDSPQAYLVMQPPHSVTRPHFHQTNQFQVFVGGGGRVGKVRSDPVTVQYAGGNTPYGPIVADDDGIHYFTLRQKWDSGAKYLPEQNELLVKGRQRQRLGVKSRTAGEGDVFQETLIEAEPDGLFVSHFTLAPGSKTAMPDAGAGGGQYHVVIAGSLIRDKVELPPLSVEFASPDQGTVDMQAGADGLEVLLLRFPRD